MFKAIQQLSHTCSQCLEYDKRRKDAKREELNEQTRIRYCFIKKSEAERNKTWREQNHERLIVEVICGCGGKFQYWNKSKHTMSKKHTSWL